MDQIEIDNMLQRAEKYNAEKYLAEAVKLLSRNKKINVEIIDYEWYINNQMNKPIFKIIYSVGHDNIVLRILETIFKDYKRPADEIIGIKPEMEMKLKIILRLAYLLFTHKED